MENPYIQAEICSYLRVEEAVLFLSLFRIKELACSIPFVDPKTQQSLILPGINPVTLELYRQIQKEGIDLLFLRYAQLGQTDLVKILLEMGVDSKTSCGAGMNALILASATGFVETVTFLIEKTPLLFEKAKDGKTPLITAAENGQEEIVRILIELSVNVNEQDEEGNSALIFAARYDYISIVKLLIANGANANIISSKGETALTMAVTYDCSEIVDILLNHPNIQVDLAGRLNFTPLLQAATGGSTDFAKKLIQAGANFDVQIAGPIGYTPLIIATLRGHISVIKILLESGANVRITDGFGRNAFYHAKKYKNEEIMALLTEYGLS